MIDVILHGETRPEKHVDGGAFAQTFLYPVALTEAPPEAGTWWSRLAGQAYVIRNGQLDPEWAPSNAELLALPGERSQT